MTDQAPEPEDDPRGGGADPGGADPVIARLLDQTGPPKLARQTESHFAALVRAIVYQQLAGRAAAAIHGRLIAAVDGDMRAETLIALSDETLRAVGLSRSRWRRCGPGGQGARRDGRAVPAGPVEGKRRQIVTRLSAVRGIGPWTAEMFLFFQLRRLDVWPVGDLGVRHGYGLAWQVPTPTARELRPLGELFRPYRSVAAWYCWRAAELYAGAAASDLTRAHDPVACQAWSTSTRRRCGQACSGCVRRPSTPMWSPS